MLHSPLVQAFVYMRRNSQFLCLFEIRVRGEYTSSIAHFLNDWSIDMQSSSLDYWSWLWLSLFPRRTRIRLTDPSDYIIQPTNCANTTRSRHASCIWENSCCSVVITTAMHLCWFQIKGVLGFEIHPNECTLRQRGSPAKNMSPLDDDIAITRLILSAW